MPVGKKWMAVVSVMAIGTIAALFFRKDASQVVFSQPSQVDSLFREHVERRLAAEPLRATPSARPIAASPKSRPPAWRITPAQPASISDAAAKSGDVQPTFHKSLNPVGALLPPIDSVVGEDIRDLADESSDTANLDVVNSGDLRHEIRDGDTLTRLAEHYLGAADRYLEIFDLNRDILTTPDLLPIGRSLRIPPREAKTADTGDDSDGEEPSRLEPQLPIVPIEPPPGEPAPAETEDGVSPYDKSAKLERGEKS